MHIADTMAVWEIANRELYSQQLILASGFGIIDLV